MDYWKIILVPICFAIGYAFGLGATGFFASLGQGISDMIEEHRGNKYLVELKEDEVKKYKEIFGRQVKEYEEEHKDER